MIMLQIHSAFANSSWHWLTSSPLVVLPFAIVLTLVIETFAVVKYGRVSNWKKVLTLWLLCVSDSSASVNGDRVAKLGGITA